MSITIVTTNAQSRNAYSCNESGFKGKFCMTKNKEVIEIRKLKSHPTFLIPMRLADKEAGKPKWIRDCKINQKLKSRNGITEYQYCITGQIVKVNPLKPWRNKSERKQYIKSRK